MSKNDYQTKGNTNSLDFSYHQNLYNLSDIDLLRQVNTSIPQQIIFIGKLEDANGATMFLSCKKLLQTFLWTH